MYEWYKMNLSLYFLTSGVSYYFNALLCKLSHQIPVASGDMSLDTGLLTLFHIYTGYSEMEVLFGISSPFSWSERQHLWSESNKMCSKCLVINRVNSNSYTIDLNKIWIRNWFSEVIWQNKLIRCKIYFISLISICE